MALTNFSYMAEFVFFFHKIVTSDVGKAFFLWLKVFEEFNQGSLVLNTMDLIYSIFEIRVPLSIADMKIYEVFFNRLVWSSLT